MKQTFSHSGCCKYIKNFIDLIFQIVLNVKFDDEFNVVLFAIDFK